MKLKQLAKIIHEKRLKGSIPFHQVYSALTILVQELSFSLLRDVPVTVKNFGTLTINMIKGHKAGYWGDKIQYTKDTKRIIFYPHDSFSQLIRHYRKDFEKKQKDS